MKKFRIAALAVTVAVVSFLSASRSAEAEPAAGRSASLSSVLRLAAAPPATVADTSGDSLHRDVAAFKKTWDKKIKKLDSRIDQEQKKIKKISADKRQKLDQQISQLKMQRDELQQEVDAAANKTADQWDEFKADVNRKYQDLNMKVKDFFKNDND
jgi:septal ring factor EnvC (AmiA/AmiB activator)